MTLEAEAKDDFGLINYGVALAVGANNPVYTPLKKDDTATLDADFRHTVALEEKGVEPDELVTWFAFAEDYGPDGELRRSTSDLYFAEVRALEEIFRQGESGGGSMEAMGGQREGEILERQRQIAIATWKLLQRGGKRFQLPGRFRRPGPIPERNLVATASGSIGNASG